MPLHWKWLKCLIGDLPSNPFIYDFSLSRNHVRTKGAAQLSTGSMKATMSAYLGLVLFLFFLQSSQCLSGRHTMSLLQQPLPLQLQLPLLPPLPLLHLQSTVHILILLITLWMDWFWYNPFTQCCSMHLWFSVWISTNNVFSDMECQSIGSGSRSSVEACQVFFAHWNLFYFFLPRTLVRKKAAVQLSTGSMKATMSASWGLVLSLFFLQGIRCPSGRPIIKLLQQPLQQHLHLPLPLIHFQSKVHILKCISNG